MRFAYKLDFEATAWMDLPSSSKFTVLDMQEAVKLLRKGVKEVDECPVDEIEIYPPGCDMKTSIPFAGDTKLPTGSTRESPIQVHIPGLGHDLDPTRRRIESHPSSGRQASKSPPPRDRRKSPVRGRRGGRTKSPSMGVAAMRARSKSPATSKTTTPPTTTEEGSSARSKSPLPNTATPSSSTKEEAPPPRDRSISPVRGRRGGRSKSPSLGVAAMRAGSKSPSSPKEEESEKPPRKSSPSPTPRRSKSPTTTRKKASPSPTRRGGGGRSFSPPPRANNDPNRPRCEFHYVPSPFDPSNFRCWYRLGPDISYYIYLNTGTDMGGLKKAIFETRQGKSAYIEGLEDPLTLKIFPPSSQGMGEDYADHSDIPRDTSGTEPFIVRK